MGTSISGPSSNYLYRTANDINASEENFSLLDSVFWMAAPKNRHSIEVNGCRRRNPQKLIEVKNDIALAGVAQWIERWPENHRVAG